jgi:pimeloyl-ACP methyl ester carboxylesterase
VKAPTLLVVGGDDSPVVDMNRKAYAALQTVKELRIIAGATHLFKEPGALEEVARLSGVVRALSSVW